MIGATTDYEIKWIFQPVTLIQFPLITVSYKGHYRLLIELTEDKIKRIPHDNHEPRLSLNNFTRHDIINKRKIIA